MAFCTSRPGVSMLVFVYALYHFLAFLGETVFNMLRIGQLDHTEVAPEYARAGLHGLFRLMCIFMCSFWIVSANNDDMRGMRAAFTFVMIRCLTYAMYAACDALYETFLMPDTLLNHIALASTIPLYMRFSTATFEFLLDAFLLTRMRAYYDLASRIACSTAAVAAIQASGAALRSPQPTPTPQ
ncbi:uncharacterized protein LOC135387522 [Ornithodoros turicata]|uniref:uncharacterized protein LOC135387522 n=1 Tax=Ornithodoros turicata TaxID=34597 RepID=UPI0031398FC2